MDTNWYTAAAIISHPAVKARDAVPAKGKPARKAKPARRGKLPIGRVKFYALLKDEKNPFPEPDGEIDGIRVWSGAVIDAYVASKGKGNA